MVNPVWLGLAFWFCISQVGANLSNRGQLESADHGNAPTVATVSDDVIMSVSLASGRKFTAALDSRTDGARLWLRFQRDRITILRPIDWNRVVMAELGGRQLPGEQLHRLVEQVRQEIDRKPGRLASH